MESVVERLRLESEKRKAKSEKIEKTEMIEKTEKIISE